MLTTLSIAIREYLEIFLIIGVFLGINKKLNLKKEKEIIFSSLIGIFISLMLPIITFYFSNQAKQIFNEKNTEILEGYLLIFSGIFITYVIFSLHKTIHHLTDKNLIFLHKKMENKIFDLVFFLLIVFFIVREGFEIALFTATTSLFFDFLNNFYGLILGFLISAIFGILTYFSYLKFSIKKIYKITEWLIIFLGSSMIANGINKLFEIYFNQKLNNFFPLKINFLPSSNSFFGHFLKNNFGLQKDFSFIILLIMIFYIFFVKKILLKNDKIKK